MSPFALYLFVILDKVILTTNVFLVLSSVALGAMFVIFLLGNFITSIEHGYSPENFNKWMLTVWKKSRIPVITIFCVSLACQTFLPNTKEAIGIYVIPKVVNAASKNEELIKLPNNVLKMANAWLESKMIDFTNEIENKIEQNSNKVDTLTNEVIDKLEDKATEIIR